jgi:hypothetical protein
MNVVVLIVACIAAAPLIIAGMLAFRRAERPRMAVDEWTDETALVPAMERRLSSEPLDLPSLVREVADSLAPLAFERFTRIAIAVSPGRAVHADPGTLQMALRDTLLAALRSSSGGQVLVSVVPFGMGVQIVVTDEGADCDQRRREADVRAASALMAMLGGATVVEARPGRGCTVTLRLPTAGAAAFGDHRDGQGMPSFGAAGAREEARQAAITRDALNRVS